MDIKEISKRNYEATVKRGLITPKTRPLQFIDKIQEEKNELFISWYIKDHFDPEELADVALVCFAMAEHYQIDLVAEMEKKAIYNEQRTD